MVFLSKEKAKEFASELGERVQPVYNPKVDEFGRIELLQSGTHDLYAEIQSHKEECDINNIIARAQAGDMSGFRDNPGAYGDFAELPKSYAEILQIMIDGQNYFDKLPIDVKQKFDNDFNKWFASYGSEEWIKSMGIEIPKDEIKPIEDQTLIKEEKKVSE